MLNNKNIQVPNPTKIFIGSDHGGFEMKEAIKEYLISQNYFVVDVGTYSKNSCDYPDIAQNLCKKLLIDVNSKFDNLPLGILICGTGIGISIAANKIPGIRCALCHNEFTAIMSRKHNNANILALGARTTRVNGIDCYNIKMVKKIINIFLIEKFDGGRHQRRINKIE